MAAAAVIDVLQVRKVGQCDNHIAAKSNLCGCGSNGSVIHCMETKCGDLDDVINLVIVRRVFTSVQILCTKTVDNVMVDALANHICQWILNRTWLRVDAIRR
eukprot:6726638-Ditylum_brightwellii.AAC.1